MRPDPGAALDSERRIGLPGRGRARIVFAIALALTIIATAAVWRSDRTKVHDQLERDTDEVTAAIDARISAYTESLIGLRSLIAADPQITHTEFHAYVRRLEIQARYPGVQVISYAPRVSAPEFPAFKRRVALSIGATDERYPPFAMRPPASKPIRSSYLPVSYVEPVYGNARLVGRDLAASPLSQKAILRTEETSAPAATGPYVMSRLGKTVKAFDVMLDVRNSQALESVEANRSEGVATLSLRVEELFANLIPDFESATMFTICDVGLDGKADSPVSIYSEGPKLEGGLAVTTRLEVGGRAWEVEARRPAAIGFLPIIVALGGILLSVLTALLVDSLEARRARAEAIARRITADLAGAAAEATRAERRFRGFIESAPDAIVIVDSDGTIQLVNEQTERLFGFDRAELVGKSVDLMVPERARETHAKRRQEFFADPKPRRMGSDRPLFGRRADGSEFPIEVALSPLETEQSQQLFSASIRDVTQRALADRRASLTHSATKVLAESIEIEEAVSQILAELAEAVGFTFAALWDAADDGSPANLRCAVTYKDPSAAPSITKRRTDGEFVAAGDWVNREPHFKIGPDDIFVPLLAGQRLIGAIELAGPLDSQDRSWAVTAIESVANQLAQYIYRRRVELEAERVKDEFFGLVSHELRTPLTSIIGYAELLEESDGSALSDSGTQALEVILRNARREWRLVRDLLLLVSVEAGGFTIKPGRVNLAELTESAIASVRPLAEARQLELVFDGRRVPEFWGDGGRLAQVLENLLTNAIKFTRPGGRIGVSLGSVRRELTITVSDTGIGISPDEVGFLFDRLYRASSAIEIDAPGVGLGLTIVQKIVEAHQGRVEVHSELGEGTRFTVHLPRRDPPDKPLARVQAQPTVAN